MDSIKSGKRLEFEVFMGRDLQKSVRFPQAIFHLSAQAQNKAYDRFTTHDNFCEGQNANLPRLSRLRAKGRNAVHGL
jgi:hypothetical protein